MPTSKARKSPRGTFSPFRYAKAGAAAAFRVALRVKGTAFYPEVPNEGTVVPEGYAGDISASDEVRGTSPIGTGDAGNKALRSDSRAYSESLGGAVGLATAPEQVTGPVVRGTLSV